MKIPTILGIGALMIISATDAFSDFALNDYEERMLRKAGQSFELTENYPDKGYALTISYEQIKGQSITGAKKWKKTTTKHIVDRNKYIREKSKRFPRALPTIMTALAGMAIGSFLGAKVANVMLPGYALMDTLFLLTLGLTVFSLAWAGGYFGAAIGSKLSRLWAKATTGNDDKTKKIEFMQFERPRS
ncbi:MAG: hypothetical protein HY401_07425 [Elusimicrobia bacterium]|nr:hypothetical protein [Elusimicrobiota bacterium]